MSCPNYAYDFAVIGGDMRQVYLAEALARHNNRICSYALCSEPDRDRLSQDSVISVVDSLKEVCSAASCVIGPIPFCKHGDALNQSAFDRDFPINQFLSDFKSGQSFFAGCIPKDFCTAATEKGVRIFDLMKNPQLALFNTIATAEGSICEAIKRSPLNLHQSSCAVLGYGKCGRTLSHYLKGMFCHVFAVSNEEEERAQAALVTDKTGSLEDFKACAGKFDFVFNTIPAMVVTSEILAEMKRSVTIIDIASFPGGVDFQTAQKLGIQAVLCLGLPGKYAPYSSAQAIKEVIERILKE